MKPIVQLNTSDLAPGMCLARNVNFYDITSKKAHTFESGQKLTDVAITQLRKSNVESVYIDTLRSEVRMISTIDKEIRSEAISGIHNLADKFINSKSGVQKSDIEQLGETTQKLIGSLYDKKDILVNIADIKMYDDYTFHHSLSVAIMAIAIGMEMGLDIQFVNEIGIAGLLHDIGKVSIPIEIINKPSRLTEEEFNIVKMHPIYAARHLQERNLVNFNVYSGIIQHHEKYDGSGYPFHLAGDKIHLYARILAVADVYDALTSNRPYRTPNPPNEAIEYIMAGNGSHFDENVVRAFIRKVAPYPTGAKVLLSNGEKACVLKNFPDAPLRPMVSVLETARCYDLAHDVSCYSIVITGLSDDSLDGQQLINM